MNKWISMVMVALLTASAGAGLADDDDDEGFGLAGILSSENSEDLPPINISVGEPLAEAPWVLKSGKYYKVELISDGSGEIGIEGANFFRAVWVDEVVVEDLEIRPFGISSFEFDDAGTMRLSFVAIKPGQYELAVPGARGDSQKIAVTIE